MSDNADISASIRIGKYIRMAIPSINNTQINQILAGIQCTMYDFRMDHWTIFQVAPAVDDVMQVRQFSQHFVDKELI